MALIWTKKRWLKVVDVALVRLYVTEPNGSLMAFEAQRALELLRSKGYRFIKKLRAENPKYR